ncbi:MAG: hypothetical protein ACTSX0_02680 [Promethearchaeota archaeon]
MIEINLTKVERGLRTERVRVVRDGKVFYREQRVGRKSSGRLGTGKIASLPKEVHKEILDQRRLGTSGAKIKEIIEEMIDADPEMSDRLKKSGVVSENGKLAITGQSLVDWAKVRGVESRIKRNTGLRAEKEYNEQARKEVDKLQSELSRVQVENKELKEKLEALRRSKAESDKIRIDQQKEIYELQTGGENPSLGARNLITDQQKKIKDLYDEINKRDQKIREAERENVKLRGKVRDVEIAMKRMMEKELNA